MIVITIINNDSYIGCYYNFIWTLQEHPLKLKVIRKFEGSKDGFLSCNPGEIITLISKKRHKYVHCGDVSNSGLCSAKEIQLQKVPLCNFEIYKLLLF